MAGVSLFRTDWMQELLDVLGAIRDQIDMLEHVEQLKAFAIAGRNLEEIEDITLREEENAEQLAMLEQQRREVIARFLPETTGEATVSELAATIPGSAGAALRAAAEEIRTRIARLRDTSHRNADLLRWASDLASSAAQWLLGQERATPTYTRSGGWQREGLLSGRDWSA